MNLPPLGLGLAARAAAVDVYSDQWVPGAREWVETGDPSHMSRPYRERLTVAAERIYKWMGPQPLTECKELPR